MKTKLGALALLACVSAPSAFAACPETGLQDVLNVYFETAKPSPNSASILSRTDAVVAQCSTDPHVLKAAAITYATVKPQTAPETIVYLSKSRALFRQMWENLKGPSTTRPVVDGLGNRAMYGFNDLYDIEGQVRNLLWQAELVLGQLADEDKPPGQAPVRPCNQSYSSDAQRAWFWIKDKGEHPGAWNFLSNAVAACNEEIVQGRFTSLLAYRARALMASVERAPDAPGAMDKLKQAKDDADRYHSIEKAYSMAGLSQTDAKQINDAYFKAAIKAGIAPTRELWFKPPYLTDPSTVRYIALELDAAWADDAKSGQIAAAKAYRAIITQAYSRATTSGDVKAARTLLFNGARDHATGKVRGPGNEALKAPPDYLWYWIDPAFKAPAPAATPAPAAPVAN